MTAVEEQPLHPRLVIDSPWLIFPDLGAMVLDVTHGMDLAGEIADLPLLCLGGHPAQECLLDVQGSGPSHDVVLAMEESSLLRQWLVPRIESLLREPVRLQVTGHPW